MKTIPEINLNEVYKRNIFRQPVGGLVDLLGNLEEIKDPVLTREYIYGIAQLYNDGIIDNEWSGNGWEEQEKILRAIHAAGIIATGQFYSGHGVDIDFVRGLILPHAPSIIKYGSRKAIKLRHLCGDMKETQRMVLEFQNHQRKIGRIDSVVAVASGGFEPAYLLAYVLEIPEIIGPRYSSWHRGDDETRIPREASRNYLEYFCREKNVAVVEDVVVSGFSMQKVINAVFKQNPKRVVGFVVDGEAREIYFQINEYRKQYYNMESPAIFKIKPRNLK